MTASDPPARGFDHSCLLIVSTAIGAFAWCYFVEVILGAVLRWQLASRLLGIASLLALPIVIPVIHYRYQSPRRSNVPDAVLTGMLSLGLLLVLLSTFGMWLQRAVGRM